MTSPSSASWIKVPLQANLRKDVVSDKGCLLEKSKQAVDLLFLESL